MVFLVFVFGRGRESWVVFFVLFCFGRVMWCGLFVCFVCLFLEHELVK